MPGLERMFVDYDLQLLRGIGSVMGLLLSSGNSQDAAEELAESMFDPDTLEMAFDGLEEEALQALSLLMSQHSRLLASAFDRRFGELRPLGSAAREREQPWTKPINVAEALFYRGLIGRAFLPNAEGVPQEYVYIPEELVYYLEQIELPPPPSTNERRPAPNPTAFVSASSAIVDDATTLLAYLQREQPTALTVSHIRYLQPYLLKPEALDFLDDLLKLAELVTAAPYRAQPQHARPFLEQSRGLQLQQLINTWRKATGYDDLARVPGLIVDAVGGARHDVVSARAMLFDWLNELPEGQWWDINDFVASAKEHSPDFFRTGVAYSTLSIRDANTQDFLTGFESWERVEGALLRYLITGPMHWLGLVDLTEANDPHPRFRVVSQVFEVVYAGQPLEIGGADATSLTVKPNGQIWATRAVNRYERFQVARIGEWVPREERYLYQITARSLAAANKRGVTVSQVLAFLRRAGADLPERLVEAIERWAQQGDEAVLGLMPVLRVKDEETMGQLRRHPNIAPLLGEALGATASLVAEENWERLQDELLKLGVLITLDD